MIIIIIIMIILNIVLVIDFNLLLHQKINWALQWTNAKTNIFD